MIDALAGLFIAAVVTLIGFGIYRKIIKTDWKD